MTLQLFLIAVPVFLAIDLLWLGIVARGFYARQLGPLMRSDVNWYAAITFYLAFVLGLVVFVVVPAVDAASWQRAAGYGALFGFVSYATYDLTNLATVERWPLVMTMVDLVWGSVLAASVAVVTYALGTAWVL